MTLPAGPIAVFDSGVGGLSILRRLRHQLPSESFIYFADQAHVPYGPRPAPQIRAFCHAISGFFLELQAKIIVVACNTATAAALDDLRQAYPHLPFVGMEPAVKPGAAATRTGNVGILATAGTFESQRYTDLMARFARSVTLYENPCTGLVPLIEDGNLDGRETRALLQGCLQPMLDAGVDTLVLGCTHYPFVLPLIRDIAGPKVQIIDPAPAVVRQTSRVLDQKHLRRPAQEQGLLVAYTTGDPVRLAHMAGKLLGYEPEVQGLVWDRLQLQV